MLLRNVHTMGSDIQKDILILEGKIQRISEHDSSIKVEPSLNFDDALIFPGLINSHDHLDFNCFPPLGHRKYPNYREWGTDIQQRDKTVINKVLGIPEKLRAQWGIYKNLLNGVTTVINHGKTLEINEEMIEVFQETHSYHSVGFEKNWKWKINRPQKTNWPLVLHNGEGIDDTASAEIDELIRWNIFKKEIIAVHGTIMNSQQAKKFKALVWCPGSNLFLLGKTADVKEIKASTKIIFGTDSTLTANWNIWEQLRIARNENALSDQELFESITSTAAGVWGMPLAGKIKENYYANLVIAKARSFDEFYQLNPEDLLLVMHRGNVVLFDETLCDSLIGANTHYSKFARIFLQESCKYVTGDLTGLVKTIREHYDNTFFPFKVNADLATEAL